MFKQNFLAVTVIACAVLTPVVVAAPSPVASPALSNWVNEVLSRNPEVQAAQAAIEAAGGRLRAAGQPLFNPELELDYEGSDINTITGGLSQTIDWADKRGARTAVARSAQVAAAAELRATYQSLATDLLRALADWHTNDAILRISDRQNTLMTRFASIAEQRRKAGDLGQVELDLAHLVSADAAFELANANAKLILSRQALTGLTGIAGPDWPQLTWPLPDIDLPQGSTDRLLDDLPSMQVALAQVAAARASVQLSTREKQPNPTIGFRIGKEDSETLTGVTVSIPLFVRNTLSAEVDVANANLIEAQRKAANHRQQAHAALVAAAQLYLNARGAWKVWEASGAPRLNQRTDLLERIWQAGELNTTDYLVQLKQALDTEVNATRQRGRMWQAWADWLAASGQAEPWLHLTGDTQ